MAVGQAAQEIGQDWGQLGWARRGQQQSSPRGGTPRCQRRLLALRAAPQ